MKILFSPSESKTSILGTTIFDFNNFIFPHLKDKREEAFKIYDNFIKLSTDKEISEFFGLKNVNDIKYYQQSYKEKTGIKAILRYSGVAYKALNYTLLDKTSQEYIDKNVIIFSNLFGPILANDILPNYKFKQGQKLGSFKIENFYKENFSKSLDEYLKNEDILDLRATFYEKFYNIKKDFTTLKFLKEGKTVSHYAKHYRGIILKEIAKQKISTLDEFKTINIDNLRLIDIKKIKNKNEILLEII
ncbi:peroxide stress protein YaaA [Campylobacter blaseri]|uniref:Peroxide stress protein YaaA n=1 Tax=Campylobacter blaseri TaxID=2042961 RepID=A0A2P8R2G5_9BACT|nr:peroxide stress protein YaaA [Campylobacter blaseri]PSM52681.1 hypothetical protein CQ405_02820 [Campylobacter blaseri]PSM54329.1 hypothetical protein CRN67_02820 [Campylobacter blaseri]QKF85981.1 peroxide stress protein YaaA [Campylobacter blaseri]